MWASVGRGLALGLIPVLWLAGALQIWSLVVLLLLGVKAAIALGIILSEATSNTASANMIIPVVIAIAQSADLSPIPPALGACLGASYGFMLPVSTPPNAIVYGSGLIPLPSKWIIEFGEPIRTDAYEPEAADDPMLLFNVTDQVRETIQQTLYALLVDRGNAFF